MIDKQKFKFDETPDMASHMYNKAIDIAFAHFESMRCGNCKHFDGNDRCVGSLNIYVHDEWSCADWSDKDD